MKIVQQNYRQILDENCKNVNKQSERKPTARGTAALRLNNR